MLIRLYAGNLIDADLAIASNCFVGIIVSVVASLIVGSLLYENKKVKSAVCFFAGAIVCVLGMGVTVGININLDKNISSAEVVTSKYKVLGYIVNEERPSMVDVNFVDETGTMRQEAYCDVIVSDEYSEPTFVTNLQSYKKYGRMSRTLYLPTDAPVNDIYTGGIADN